MRDETDITWLDVVAVWAGGALAVLTFVSLLLAELGQHSLAAVLIVSAGLGAVLVLLARPRRRLVRDLGSLAAALVVLGIGTALTVPGFSYAVADKDPGGYVAQAVQIARGGGVSFTDPALAAGLPVVTTSPGARFTSIWIRDRAKGTIVPQFVHGQQALLATGYDAGGWLGLRLVTPLCGLVALLGVCALGRRLAVAVVGRQAAIAGALVPGLLLATCSLQVWQARTPGSEVLAEALWTTTLLGVAVGVRTRWAGAALVAGLALGVGFLVRVDGVLGLLLGLGTLAALLAVRRGGLILAAAVLGCVVTLPLGLYEAYVVSRDYAKVNHVPGPALLLGLSVGSLAVAGALATRWPQLHHRVEDLLERHRTVLARAGAAALLLALVTLVTRRWWLGRDLHPDGRGGIVRSFNEVNVVRLSWFLTYPGAALAIGGALLVLLAPRWRATAWVVLLPTVAMSAVYLWDARNAPPLMFWARRYVPTVLVGLVLLAGVAVAWLWVRRRVLGAVAVTAVLALALPLSVRLRAHDQWAGSWQLGARIAAAGGGDTVFLWDTGHGSFGPDVLFAVPVWLEHGQLSAALPRPTRDRGGYADSFGAALHRPVLVVGPGAQPPAGMDPARLVPVLRMVTTLPVWQESLTAVPDRAAAVPVDLTVWRWTVAS